MIEKLLNWLFGDKCQHDFAMWEKKVWHYTRPPRDMAEFVRWGQVYEREFTHHYQERKCKSCGYVEQKELDHG